MVSYGSCWVLQTSVGPRMVVSRCILMMTLDLYSMEPESSKSPSGVLRV